MTAKSSADKAHAELAELKAAMEQAKFATGNASIVIVNDPEQGLDDYRLGLNDTSQTISIGPSEYPGRAWYEAYQEAARAGDRERSRELLQYGARGIRDDEIL
jgi:hypothetical protein